MELRTCSRHVSIAIAEFAGPWGDLADVACVHSLRVSDANLPKAIIRVKAVLCVKFVNPSNP
jgi:hypothetical protein